MRGRPVAGELRDPMPALGNGSRPSGKRNTSAMKKAPMTIGQSSES